MQRMSLNDLVNCLLIWLSSEVEIDLRFLALHLLKQWVVG